MKAHPASPELFLAFGAFLEDHREALADDDETTTTTTISQTTETTSKACFARAAELAAGTAFFRTVRDVRRAYGHQEKEARGAEETEPLSFDGSEEDARGLGMAEW